MWGGFHDDGFVVVNFFSIPSLSLMLSSSWHFHKGYFLKVNFFSAPSLSLTSSLSLMSIGISSSPGLLTSVFAGSSFSFSCFTVLNGCPIFSSFYFFSSIFFPLFPFSWVWSTSCLHCMFSP